MLALYISAEFRFNPVFLFIIRFFRFVPIFDPEPLNPARRFGAVISLLVFILCFMPSPFIE